MISDLNVEADSTKYILSRFRIDGMKMRQAERWRKTAMLIRGTHIVTDPGKICEQFIPMSQAKKHRLDKVEISSDPSIQHSVFLSFYFKKKGDQ